MTRKHDARRTTRKPVRDGGSELWDLLTTKYRAHPQAFRSLLPEIAQLLDRRVGSSGAPAGPFGLTERERAYHQRELAEVYARLDQPDGVARDEAVRALEHWAILTRDDALPPPLTTDGLIRLLKTVTGTAPASVTGAKTFTVHEAPDQAVNQVQVLRGVTLALTRDMHLLSITVIPAKLRERRKVLAFVGSGADTADVAARHDAYLAEGTPHAAA